MTTNKGLSTLYGTSYFTDRDGSDAKRQLSFADEKKFVERFTSVDGTVLDVGCSTGEFLAHLGWAGERFGIEISEYAADKARKRGINIVDKYDVPNSLDAVIYRGTIQHLDSPFRSLEKAVKTLKPGGHVFFIATPNINSVYYRTFKELPALDPDRNFYLPSDQSLINIAKIFDLSLGAVEYPYFDSPYASPVLDHIRFLAKLVLLPFGEFGESIKFSFHKNMMNIVFKKL